MREMKELRQIKKFLKTARRLGSGASDSAILHMESFLSFRVPSHEIALLEKRQKEEVAEPAEQETNKHLSALQTAGFPRGPGEAGEGSGRSRKQADLPTNHLRTQRGPPEAPCRPGSGFPHRGGTQFPTLWVTGSGFQVTHVNKIQKHKIEATGVMLSKSSARPSIVF